MSALRAALELAEDVPVAGPPDGACDGCSHDVLRTQERWRRDGVRVIRPRTPVVDAQALVLPLRHVVSFGDLTAAELVSVFARLDEVLEQFAMASGTTGLSCFVNDGAAARQETPHVHLHVFGRSIDEEVNPFSALATRDRTAARSRVTRHVPTPMGRGSASVTRGARSPFSRVSSWRTDVPHLGRRTME